MPRETESVIGYIEVSYNFKSVIVRFQFILRIVVFKAKKRRWIFILN